ncbi:MAG: DUF4476 domain-containing protein [Brevinematales bacterium]|nr:DUF4476 domain-containing protein [Brevinematales bacterium]
MKNFILIMIIFLVNLGYSEEVTYKDEDIKVIQSYLDNLIFELDGLPPYKRRIVYNYIREIKNILLSNQLTNKKVYTEEEFNNLLNSIKNNPFYDSQKIILKQAAKKSYFYMKQIKEIVLNINFMDNRRDCLSILLPKVVDPENVGILFDIFWTKDDKEYINKILEQQ